MNHSSAPEIAKKRRFPIHHGGCPCVIERGKYNCSRYKTTYQIPLTKINKKGQVFRRGKGLHNEYSSKLGFNVYVLRKGEYTLVVEFFPPVIDDIRLNVVSTQWNIGQQSIKLFLKYSRSIVHLNKSSRTHIYRHEMSGRCRGHRH